MYEILYMPVFLIYLAIDLNFDVLEKKEKVFINAKTPDKTASVDTDNKNSLVFLNTENITCSPS